MRAVWAGPGGVRSSEVWCRENVSCAEDNHVDAGEHCGAAGAERLNFPAEWVVGAATGAGWLMEVDVPGDGVEMGDCRDGEDGRRGLCLEGTHGLVDGQGRVQWYEQPVDFCGGNGCPD